MNNEVTGMSELPKGWTWTRMGEVCLVQGGYAFKSKDYKDSGIPLLRISNISEHKVTFDRDTVFLEAGYKEKYADFLVMSNDIVIALSGATTGKFGIYDKHEIALLNQRVGRLKYFCPDLVSILYFFYYTEVIRQDILRRAYGAAQPNISPADLAEFIAPLPPFPEQHRIVAKIEELFTRLDAGVEALKKIKAQLKRYRQAVLKHAFEGKLTEEWRQAHRDELEPASVLLERIKQERQKKSKGKYKELLPLDTSDLPKLPGGWAWARAGEIYDIVGGGTPSTAIAEYWQGDTPWITSADIFGLRDIRPRRQITRQAIENSATNLVPAGSLIVVTRVGLGKIALTKAPICFSQDSQALVAGNTSLFPDYSLYCLSEAVQVFRYKHRGTTINGVTKKQLEELPFAVSPLTEQHRIVEEIERRFSVADEIEKTVDHSLKQAERLRQSILKRAFEGKLIPQDPNDEPAEKLLERIKLEKSQREKAGGRIGRGHKSK